MMRNWFWLLISAAAAAAEAAPPAQVELAYDILRNGSGIAEVVHQVQHDGRSYQLVETWKGRGFYALRGTARRSSHGLISAEGLKPLEFIDERAGRRRARVRFDWQAKTVIQEYRGEPRTEPLPRDAHDRLAFLFDFAFAPPDGGEVAFDLLDGRGQSRHVYSIAGRERVVTPAGPFEALKLVRETREERAEIWLATERSYLPVRILLTDKDGTRYDQVIRNITAP
jgi:hypothetical protein